MIISTIDIHRLYELPWSGSDNPNGWIEPTTFCQLQCPGCYRGLAERGRARENRPLYEMQEEVDFHLSQRNAQTISIAGGEPLLYPYLGMLTQYAADRGAKVKIYTNGLLLTEERIHELKNTGVTECLVHIDKYQRGNRSEEEMMPRRQELCDMFRKVGGINLGFIQPLSSQNLEDIKILASFYQQNADIVHIVVFTLLKEMLPGKTLHPSLEVSIDTVSHAVKKSFGIEYCAYLGKRNSSHISWLFSLSAYRDGKLIGSYDAAFYKKLQERYHERRGRYFFTVRNHPIFLYQLLRFSANRSAKQIFMTALNSPFKAVHHQVVLIINGPDHKQDGWDLCAGCPDAMLHEGKLVPSCLLERIRAGEVIAT